MRFLTFFLAFLGLVANLSAENLGYVTNYQDGTVSVVDLDKGEQIDVIAVGVEPLSIAITSDGTLGYVANSAEHTVSVIDLKERLEKEKIDVGVAATPGEVALTPDGKRVVVTNTSSNTLSIIELQSHTVRTVAIGDNPQGVAISPDNAEAYVACLLSNSISVVDLENAIVTGVIAIDGPLTVTISSDGTRLYVTSFETSEGFFNEIDLTDHEIKRRISLGPSGGGTFEIAGGRGITVVPDIVNARVFLIDLDAMVVIDTLPVGSRSTAAAITDDEQFAYITQFDTGELAVLNLDTREFSSPITVGRQPYGVELVETEPFTARATVGRDHLLTQTDLFVHLRWNAPYSDITLYSIYADQAQTRLIGTTLGSVTEFIDHNRHYKETITYHVVAYRGATEVGTATVTVSTGL